MDAYAGEVTAMHPFYAYSSPARAYDLDLQTTNEYAGPNHLTANIQHGSWSVHKRPGKAPEASFLNSNQQSIQDDLEYTKDDVEAVIEWTKRHVETTWHSLGRSPVLEVSEVEP